MIGERENKILNSVSLSATTVKRRILDMSHDVLKQIIGQVNTSPPLHFMQFNWMNPQILQAYHSSLYLFDISAMGKY